MKMKHIEIYKVQLKKLLRTKYAVWSAHIKKGKSKSVIQTSTLRTERKEEEEEEEIKLNPA